MSDNLGEFEMLVLMAVLRLEDAAYPPAVRDQIAERTDRAVSRGAVYITLDRLETKRLLASRLDASAPGRARRYYRIAPRGVRALRRALEAVERMREGLGALRDGVERA